MISFTLENIAILTIFQLLVAGIILCSTVAVLYLQRTSRVSRTLTLVAVAFFLYAFHLLMEGLIYYRNLSSSISMALPQPWDSLMHSVETAAFGALALAYLPHWRPVQTGKRFWVLTFLAMGLVGATPPVIHHLWLSEMCPGRCFTSLFNGALLLSVSLLHLRMKGLRGLFVEAPLCMLALSHFLQATMQEPPVREWPWIAVQTSALAGLGLFALVLDHRTRNLQIRFFLRLNLTFVVIASILIIIVTETERREYLRLAEHHASELTEFVQGHLLYSYDRGMRPPALFEEPSLIHRITAEFGELIDLRRIRISLENWAMEMSYEDDWTVTHRIWPINLSYSHLHPPELGKVVTLRPIPLTYRGRPLGSIELDQGLQTINTRIAHQMRLIFVTFTLAVVIAAVLFNLTVQRANRTIQNQFRELQTTQEQLARAARLASVGELAGGVAHEINNPAGIILTTSDYLMRKMDQGKLGDSYEDLEVVRRQARRIADIVNNLLAFSRRTSLNKRLTDVNAVLDQSLALLAPRFHSQRIEVERRLADGVPSVIADPDRLEEVFVNLLNNAADAMPGGGKLSVETSVADSQPLKISIVDSGDGIREEHLKNIFDPFFTTKPKGRGTGLGLSITYGIIRDHGGEIEVESQVGRGTVFHILLPTKREAS